MSQAALTRLTDKIDLLEKSIKHPTGYTVTTAKYSQSEKIYTYNISLTKNSDDSKFLATFYWNTSNIAVRGKNAKGKFVEIKKDNEHKEILQHYNPLVDDLYKLTTFLLASRNQVEVQNKRAEVESLKKEISDLEAKLKSVTNTKGNLIESLLVTIGTQIIAILVSIIIMNRY